MSAAETGFEPNPSKIEARKFSLKQVGRAAVYFFNNKKAQRIAAEHLPYVPIEGDEVTLWHSPENCGVGVEPCEPLTGVVTRQAYLSKSGKGLCIELLNSEGITYPRQLLVKNNQQCTWETTGWKIKPLAGQTEADKI